MTSLYYDLVPKDPRANVAWRIRCRERAMEDKQFQDAFYQACMDDILFFCASVLWVHEPRARIKQRPMVPWVHQEPVILAMDAMITEAMKTEQPMALTLKKSRAQGGTYIYLAVTIQRALKEAGFTVGIVTRNESLVDSRVDDSAVMFKVAWMLDQLPAWMLPKGYERNSTEHVIRLPNGSGWSGYAATADVARGGRTSLFCFDEPGSEEFIAGNRDYRILSSVSHVSNCVGYGTPVITERGIVPIQNVRLTDRVWDGNMWVTHDGLKFQGVKDVISAYGIRLTPDHQVLTTRGWKDAAERLDREEIRLPDGFAERYLTKKHAWREKVGERLLDSKVRLRNCEVGTGASADRWKDNELWLPERKEHLQGEWSASNVNLNYLQEVVVDASALQQSKRAKLRRLRWSRNQGVRSLACLREFLRRHGRSSRPSSDRPLSRQRRELRTRKLSLGDCQTASKQQKVVCLDRYTEWSYDGWGDSQGSWNCEIDGCATDFTGVVGCRSIQASNAIQERRIPCRNIARHDVSEGDCGVYWNDSIRNNQQNQAWNDWRRRTETIEPAKIPVYDLLNCGPRRAFTVIDDDGCPLLVHNCVFLCSTFGVDSGVFYESATDPDNPRVYTLSWLDNPIHSKNAYNVHDGVAKALRPQEQAAVDEYVRTHQREIKAIDRRGHKIEGKIQSPWYNAHRLLPGATPRYIARELDMDPRGAVGKCFPPELLDRMKRDCCNPPVWQGQPVFDSETLKLTGLIPREEGPLKLWFKPGIDNTPPLGPFTVGCDIASGGEGAYSSNSVASCMDDRTGEQVLEYTIKGLETRPFARRVVGLCLWMRNALLGWEDSGASGRFAKEIMEVVYYGNVYYRNVTQLGSQKKSRKPGWPCRDEDKADMFEQMALAMETGDYIPRSESMIVECGEYEWDNGKIVHAPTKNKGATEKNHGDRAIAGGGCWLVFSTDKGSISLDTGDQQEDIVPEYGSFLWRERREKDSRVGCSSPRFGIRNLLQGTIK